MAEKKYNRGHEHHTQISVRLTSRSIQDAINAVEEYRDKIAGAEDEIREAIAIKLRDKIEEKLFAPIYDDLVEGGKRIPDAYVEISESSKTVTVVGKQAIFVEFGAGVHHEGPVGSIPNPNAPPWVKPIGTFGKGRGSKDMWVIGRENGEPVWTYGTPASMPIYHSVEEVKAEIPEILSEIFD